MPGCFPKKSRRMQDVILESSPGSITDPKRVLIVMDALKEFSIELLEWVLKNFTFRDCCSITLLGIMPWLNIPLSSKTWSDIWALNLEDLSIFCEKNGFKNDPKYQKIQSLIDLCQHYGVMPEIISAMGHPRRLLVVEQICSRHATLVVFDRHHDRKDIQYYAEKVPCNMVVMNDNGEADLIRKRNLNSSEEADADDDTPALDTPSSVAHCTTSIISQQLKKCLKTKNHRGKNDEN